jgi:hypothetical protein
MVQPLADSIKEMNAGEILDFLADNEVNANDYFRCVDRYLQLTGEALPVGDFS